MKGRNGSTSFLPLKRKGGFQRKLSFKQCLTKEQTKYIYDKVETRQELGIRKLVHQNNADSAKHGILKYWSILWNSTSVLLED